MDIAKVSREQAAALVSGPSVGDLAAFEALPEAVQDLARRVLMPPPAADAIAAYQAGWEECAEAWNPPACPARERVIEIVKDL